MADRPIIFSAPMVRALLDGRKTMTRRLANHEVTMPASSGVDEEDGTPWREPERVFRRPNRWTFVQPGDRLWVRENWRTDARCDDERPLSIGAVEYEASERQFPEMPIGKLRPSIHMPRWASRLTLTVTAVRVEQLQEITLGDICAEGLAQSIYDFKPVHRGFDAWIALWDSLHGEGAWDANPAVAVISFTVENRNIDA